MGIVAEIRRRDMLLPGVCGGLVNGSTGCARFTGQGHGRLYEVQIGICRVFPVQVGAW